MKHTTANAMRLRAKVNNYAKQHGILAQVVLQNYMFECLLDRISRSKYADNFVIKGGILVSSIVGLDVRSTMDMDTNDFSSLTALFRFVLTLSKQFLLKNLRQ